MRILFTSKKRGWNGETACIHDLIQGCLAADHEVILGSRPEAELRRRLAGSAVRLLDLELEHDATALGPFLRDLRRLGPVLSEVEVVHAHASWDTWVVASARFRHRRPVPLLRTRHNLKPIRSHPLNRWLYRSAITRLVAPSRTIARDLQSYPFVPEQKVCQIQNGIDAEHFDPSRFDRPRLRRELRERLGAPADAPVVGYVSRLTERKEPQVLVGAAARLLQRGSDAWFYLAGALDEGSEFGRDLRRQVARFEPRIRLLGFESRVPELLVGSDVFVLPAPTEPFGLAPVEAMAMGCPPVCADGAGLAESILPGETGLLFPPHDEEGCAAALLSLLEDPDKRARLAEAGRGHVLAHYTRQRMVSQYLSEYERLARG